MSLFLATSPAMAGSGWERTQRGMSFEAGLSSERLRPEVAGESRVLHSETIRLHLREELAYGLHGGLVGGLPSIRWQAPDHDDSPRMGGHLLGLSLGGRHPHEASLALVWEASWIWSEVGGRLEDEDLDLNIRETAGRLGLQWQNDHFAITLGMARQHLNGDERRSGEARSRSRRLSWTPDDHAFAEIGLHLGDGGWIAFRYSDLDERASSMLIFARQF